MCNPVDPSKGLFQLLPKEITTEILHRVEIKDWKTCARVSKYFKGLTEDKTAFEKHPGYSSYMHGVAAHEVSSLLCQDEKFFNLLKNSIQGNHPYTTRENIESYTWCHLLNEGKKSLDDSELETLKGKLLIACVNIPSSGHHEFMR